MRLDLYQQETARIGADNETLLQQAHAIMTLRPLSPLEQGGVLHALQILIENAIGKAKQLLKYHGRPVPISGYDTFKTLSSLGLIPSEELPQWNAVVGLRNRIVHDYMNIEMEQIYSLIRAQGYAFVVRFLLREPQSFGASIRPE